MTIVDRGHVKSRPGGAQQRETTAQAEPDDSDLARAIVALGEQLAGRVQQIEGRTRPGLELLERPLDAAQPVLALEEVRCERQVTVPGELVGFALDVVIQPESLR